MAEQNTHGPKEPPPVNPSEGPERRCEASAGGLDAFSVAETWLKLIEALLHAASLHTQKTPSRYNQKQLTTRR